MRWLPANPRPWYWWSRWCQARRYNRRFFTENSRTAYDCVREGFSRNSRSNRCLCIGGEGIENGRQKAPGYPESDRNFREGLATEESHNCRRHAYGRISHRPNARSGNCHIFLNERQPVNNNRPSESGAIKKQREESFPVCPRELVPKKNRPECSIQYARSLDILSHSIMSRWLLVDDPPSYRTS